MEDIKRVKLDGLPELQRAVVEQVAALDTSSGTTLNAAWTLMLIAARLAHSLRSAGAALTEDNFAEMARDAYRNWLAGKGD